MGFSWSYFYFSLLRLGDSGSFSRLGSSFRGRRSGRNICLLLSGLRGSGSFWGCRHFSLLGFSWSCFYFSLLRLGGSRGFWSRRHFSLLGSLRYSSGFRGCRNLCLLLSGLRSSRSFRHGRGFSLLGSFRYSRSFRSDRSHNLLGSDFRSSRCFRSLCLLLSSLRSFRHGRCLNLLGSGFRDNRSFRSDRSHNLLGCGLRGSRDFRGLSLLSSFRRSRGLRSFSLLSNFWGSRSFRSLNLLGSDFRSSRCFRGGRYCYSLPDLSRNSRRFRGNRRCRCFGLDRCDRFSSYIHLNGSGSHISLLCIATTTGCRALFSGTDLHVTAYKRPWRGWREIGPSRMNLSGPRYHHG